MKNISILIILIIALLMSGCDREIESDVLGFELPDEPSIPINLTLGYLSDSVTVSWEIEDTLAGIEFAVYYIDSIEYYADTATAEFLLWETTSLYSSTIGSLTPGNPYLIFVATVTANNIEGSKSEPVSVRTGVLSIVLNNGDEFTDSRNVNVSFIVPRQASLVMLSEDVSLVDAIWQTYSSRMSYEFSDSDELKRLYARIRFNDGSESENIADSIVLDTKAMIDSVYFSPTPVSFSSGDTVMFYLVTNEIDGEAEVAFSGVNSIELDYDNVLSDPGLSSYVYTAEYVIPANLEIVDGVVTGNFTDVAGNNADPIEASFGINIANDPDAVVLTAVPISSSSIRLNWSRNNNDDFTAYQIYRNTTTPINTSFGPIAVLTSNNTLTYTDDQLPNELTGYYYSVFVYDNTGRSTGSNTVEAVTLFNEFPNSVELSGRIELQDGDSVVVLSWNSNSDDDFSMYRVYRYSDSTTSNYNLWNSLSIIGSSGVTSFTDDLPDVTENYYQVQVVDIQGKRSNSNWIEINF